MVLRWFHLIYSPASSEYGSNCCIFADSRVVASHFLLQQLNISSCHSLLQSLFCCIRFINNFAAAWCLFHIGWCCCSNGIQFASELQLNHFHCAFAILLTTSVVSLSRPAAVYFNLVADVITVAN
jgi:hypothetical protein